MIRPEDCIEDVAADQVVAAAASNGGRVISRRRAASISLSSESRSWG